jgi:NAD(P)H-dependent FMN reductase
MIFRTMTELLSISGSLRAGSSNTVLLEAVAALVSDRVQVRQYGGLGSLPHFNPDLESEDARLLPPEVAELRRMVGECDALIVSTPEYAHGLPGSFKNALDWLVGSTEFPGKVVAILSPSARSVHARAQLREILTTMSARVLDGAQFVIPLPRDATVDDVLADSGATSAIRSAITEVLAALP